MRTRLQIEEDDHGHLVHLWIGRGDGEPGPIPAVADVEETLCEEVWLSVDASGRVIGLTGLIGEDWTKREPKKKAGNRLRARLGTQELDQLRLRYAGLKESVRRLGELLDAA